jgi:conjugal transfer mating pair stabilization protein TraG
LWALLPGKKKIMDFTIYTLGDNGMFRAVLTCVAMIFDPANSDTWVSTGGVGIGAAAALGLLLSLILLLFMAIQSQKFELGLMLVLVLAYAVLFVPKFTVNLEDIYSGSVTKVDNIPLGIALPAALASNLSYDLGNKLETVFSTVDGNYLSQSSQGFLTPLKVLASLRNGWKQVYTRDPDLTASFVQYAQICGAGKIDQQAMNTHKDSINYLLTNPPTSGNTLYYSKSTGSYPNGTLMPCADAAAKLLTDTDNLVNDQSFTKVSDILNGAMDTGKGKIQAKATPLLTWTTISQLSQGGL